MILTKYKDSIIRLLVIAITSFALALVLFAPASAANYDCGAYGAGSFNNGQVCGSSTENSGAGSSNSNNGALNNTGQALSIIIPALMILAGTVMLYRLGRKRSKSPES